jgi:hypothetical protein
MITLESRSMIEVMPDVADHYLNFNTLPEQRQLRLWHVQELVDKMKSGLFRFGEIGFCKIKDGGEDVVVNGQHVCHAIIEFDKPIPCVIERYRVDTPLERSELFRQFEILPRHQTEMVNVEAGALSLTWPSWITHLVVAALTIDHRFQATGTILQSAGGNTPSLSHKAITISKTTKELRVKALRRYLAEGDFICKILTYGAPSEATRKTVKHIARAPVAFMMMETWRKNDVQALKFWQEVRDGERLTKGSPTKALREFLLESVGRGKIGYTLPNNHQYIYKTAVAWNAFMERRSTALRYRPALQPPPLKAWSNNLKKEKGDTPMHD